MGTISGSELRSNRLLATSIGLKNYNGIQMCSFQQWIAVGPDNCGGPMLCWPLSSETGQQVPQVPVMVEPCAASSIDSDSSVLACMHDRPVDVWVYGTVDSFI